jgi:capsular polysaccharide biosynthesis protein
MEKETIFYLEGRGGMYLFHFFVYNLGGLYYILNKQYNVRGQENTSVLLENEKNIVDFPTNSVKFPIKIHMKDILQFQRETFEIIKDKFILIEDLSQIENYEIISIYGEPVITQICENPTIIYPFLRNLFLDYLHYTPIKNKRIFITRKGSHIYNNNTLKRFILNEYEIKEQLQKYNFEYIQLEEYTMPEKIKLFMESEVIVSSHSGSFTLSLFAHKETKIIEILNNGTQGFSHNHYIDICSTLGLNYNRYSNISEDANGNFHLDFTAFEEYLKNIL